jgi:hypothetical protein
MPATPFTDPDLVAGPLYATATIHPPSSSPHYPEHP